MTTRLSRRRFTKATGSTIIAASVGAPFIGRSNAATPIKIGVPTALSGVNSLYGAQVKRGCEFFQADINAKGGVMGRPVELIIEDLGSDPATAIRKAERLVLKEGIKILTGTILSSEALAIASKCPEWGVLYVSSINGAGSLTAKNYNDNVFRVNTSGPMGSRVVSLYLKDSPLKRFYGLGLDYVYGRETVGAFAKLMQSMGREYIASDFVPIGTKDFSNYIAKIKNARPEAVYLAFNVTELTIFFKQAHEFELTNEMKFFQDFLDLDVLRAVGDLMAGTIGSARYTFTADNPKNNDFVKRYYAATKAYPDFEAEAYNALDWLCKIFTKTGTTEDINKIRAAWEDDEFIGLKGKYTMRKCDHQASQPGFVVEAVKDSNYPHLIAKIIGSYPADKVIPKCRSEVYDD